MARLHREAFDQGRPWSEEEFASLLSLAGTFAIGDRHAFALYRVVLDEVELLTIVTHPSHRRLGQATALMKTWHAQARSAGATLAFLEVASDNVPARALYERMEYAQTGMRKAYYKRPCSPSVDAVLMSRALT
ncbi:GNAT family N-acetyltransferase [Thalassococcus sp. S3]|uniref:GNAT family N-acetyltransferase n=1 Tax=Thalassococcus sp. S3 TaxID=2017482 RepID=UPI0010243FCF|nr:GNAT family N-acetyltransferase [Thalassococcus sp. S3]QBF33610.1 ribosomal-protein-alanine acetyltransferase [Thalassococcus sp. S3]